MSDIGPDLQRLLERVRGATGPDRELEAEVCAALNYLPDVELPALTEGWVWLYEAGHTFGDGPSVHALPVAGEERGLGGATRKPQPISSSVDAVAALAEKVLPGCDLTVTFGRNPRAEIIWGQCIAGGAELRNEPGATPALAALAAVLAAKIAAEPDPAMMEGIEVR